MDHEKMDDNMDALFQAIPSTTCRRIPDVDVEGPFQMQISSWTTTTSSA